jgi:methionine-rich copper-binding protein CopC
MKFRSLVLASMLALASIAQAHTHLESATPADNSVLASPPQQIMLNFSEPTRLTALTLQKEGDEEPNRIEPLPSQSSDALRVPVPRLAPGKYVVKWRVIGDDNHVMSGSLHFTITGR